MKRLFFVLAGLACANATAAGLVTPALAAPTASAAPTTQVHPIADLIHHLHDVNILLAEAKHDYDGQRAEAMHKIHKAIELLKESLPKKHHSQLTQHTPGKGIAPRSITANKSTKQTQATPTTLPDENQATSDAMLQKAINKLNALEGHPGWTAQAKQEVDEAVKHLHHALKLK